MYVWSALFYLSLVVWLPVVTTSAVQEDVGTLVSGSFRRVVGRVLRGHVIHEFETFNPFFCRKECGSYGNCLSINVFTIGDQKFLCQLNSAHKDHSPETQFVSSSTGEYFDIKEQKACSKAGACKTYDKPCRDPKPLGMESGAIPDSALSASTVWSSMWSAQCARLRKYSGYCGWLHAESDDPLASWLQVDLGKETVVTAVSTQGACIEKYYVKSYVIWYSNDAVNWQYYEERGETKEFVGNTDYDTVVTNYFKKQIVARYVRLTPMTSSGWAEMRLEYHGCPLEN